MSRRDTQQGHTGQTADDAARSQRIAAMRELAGSAVSPSALTPGRASAKPAQQRRHRMPVLLVALTVIVLLASAGAAWQGWFPWQQRKQMTNVRLASVNLASYNLHCPSSAVWSPDNMQIAILAQLGACTNSDAGIVEPNVVALFSSQGKLERLLYPDTLTLGKNAHTTPQPTPTSSAVSGDVPTYTQYFGMSWSPDGKQLALPYYATFQHAASILPENIMSESGVILIPGDGADGSKLFSPHASYGDIWDLQAGARTHPGDTVQQPAFAYTWSTQGRLLPAANPASSAPVGNPLGASSFTIWQPGLVRLDREHNALEFTTSFIPWSPDGRYIAPSFAVGGRLVPNTQSISRASDGAYQIPPRDNGLLIAASQLKSPANSNASSVAVAWRGDGQYIAATQLNPLVDQIRQRLDSSVVPAAAEQVAIYDCATGTKRLTLTTAPLANPLQVATLQPQPAVSWSTTGKRIFLLDAPFDALTIWDVAL